MAIRDVRVLGGVTGLLVLLLIVIAAAWPRFDAGSRIGHVSAPSLVVAAAEDRLAPESLQPNLRRPAA